MKKIVCLVIFILAAMHGQAFACSCAYAPPKTLEQIKAEKIKVLLGRVLSRTKTGGDDINRGHLIYRVEIEKSINLPASGVISVRTAPNGALCGVNLNVDEERVLFIDGEAPDYSLSLCANIGQLRSDDPPRRAWDKILNLERAQK
jgi:hypothetical protein